MHTKFKYNIQENMSGSVVILKKIFSFIKVCKWKKNKVPVLLENCGNFNLFFGRNAVTDKQLMFLY